MGFKIGWLALRDVSVDEGLDLVGMRDTGVTSEIVEDGYGLTALSNGWVVVWFNEFGAIDAAEVSKICSSHEGLWVNLHEGVMYSEVGYVENGVVHWFVAHDCAQGYFHLDCQGSPPYYAEIVSKLRSEQDADGGENSDVDYAFDVPVELAFAMTGFRHDLFELPGHGELVWSILERRK
ncbi:hypothetical protein [Sandaracinobacteroides saxicola]|uniref:Uncharacterized protein n=1 Tax=Sandaracinobacteroides saxicola TaxID=2759707 RepID=A0A7G5IL58_9SPHN|nr:hypothetical protein [Sandaracinobacteroides saxicola]QMW24100.1 hypothetical protein H3309_06460 [Sandaracinobacteroides saxicola]